MANQVLSRPMFKPSPNQVAPTVSGIGSMTTPDQNAQALKTMFAPQPAYKRGGEVIDGVAHFAEGDEVVAPESLIPQRRYSGTSPDPADTRSYRERYGLPALSQFQRDVGTGIDAAVNAVVPDERPATQEQKDLGEGRMKAMSDAIKAQRATMEGVEGARGRVMDRTSNAPPKPGYFGSSDPAAFDAQTKAREEYDAETLRQAQGNLPPASPNLVTPEAAAEERLRAATRAALEAVTPEARASLMQESTSVPGFNRVTTAPMASALSPPVPPPALPPVADGQELQIQSIRARREASEKQREENKYLALLSAGLGMMGGKSRNAFENIGAGGQQGIATFAGLEKTRREDEATRRHEDIQMAQMAQQKTLSENQLRQQKELTLAQLAKDPETVRTYAALGGWKAGDPPEKFQEAVLAGALRAKEPDRIKALQDYITASQNPMSGITPEKARQAQEELLRLGLGQSGQPAMAAPRGTVLDLNGKPVAGR